MKTNSAGINLIPLPRLEVMARRRRVHRWLAAAGAYAVILIVGYTMCVASAGSDVDATGAALEKTNRRIDDLNRALESLRPQLAEAQTKLVVARTVGDQPDWSLLLTVISSTLDEEIVLNNARLDMSDATIAAGRQSGAPTSRPSTDPGAKFTVGLQGFARSQAAVTQFVLRLERLGLFDRVEMMNSSRQPFGSADATGFRIECELRRIGGVRRAHNSNGAGTNGSSADAAGRKSR
jgi:Tfp pilus assembly protein PilN